VSTLLNKWTRKNDIGRNQSGLATSKNLVSCQGYGAHPHIPVQHHERRNGIAAPSCVRKIGRVLQPKGGDNHQGKGEVMPSISVRKIAASDTHDWLLTKHYAKRLCPISYAFGAFRGENLIGVVTYGTPASAPLKSGVCGPEHKHLVIELNRLVCENTKNVASLLVGRSLQMLPKPKIVVSYADLAQGHIGYVYQATNFIYTGLSAKRTDWKVRGLEHLHGATIADMSRGQPDRAKWMREKFGDDFYLQERSRKHRYVYFVGDKRWKRSVLACLKYRIEPYPK